MKKHLLNGLLILALLFVGVGTFSSCKDSNEDALAKTEASITDALNKKIAELQAQYDALKETQEACKSACEEKQQELENRIIELEKLNGKLSDLEGKVDANKTEIDNLKAEIDNLKNVVIPGLVSDIASLKADLSNLEARVTSLEGTVQNLSLTLTGRIDALDLRLGNLEEQFRNCCDEVKGRLSTLEGNYTSLLERIIALENNYVEADKIGQATVTTPGASEPMTLQDALNYLYNYVNEQIILVNETITNVKNDLQGQIDGLKDTVTDLQAQIDQLKADKADKTEIQALENRINDLNETINGIVVTINNLNTTIQDIQNTVTNQGTLIEGLDGRVGVLETKVIDGINAWAWIELNKARIDALETAVGNLKTTVEQLGLKDQDLQNQIDAITTKLDTKVNNLQDQIDALTTKFNDLSDTVDGITLTINGLSGKFTDLEGRVVTLEGTVNSQGEKITELNATLSALSTTVQGLDTRLTALEGRVTVNEQAINQLKADVESLFHFADRLNKLVTGIITQATTNPVFGTLNMPFDVRSNMLMTYYGEAEVYYTFPSNSSAAEFDNSLVFTAKDMQMLQACSNFKALQIEPGQTLMDTDEGNAGMVFVTVNPNNVDFTGVSLPLVNSQDEESGIKLSGLVKSDKVLTFGYSKAANNGFYEAKATLAPADIAKVKINVEPGLKSAFKEALKDRKQNDFIALLKVLYDQFNGILPANGLKAAWQAPNAEGIMTDYAVYSEYNLAATALKPLSFKFLYGVSSPRKLPVITPISGFEFDLSKFTFDIDVPEITISGVDIDFHLSKIEIDYDGKIKVEIENYPIIDPVTNKVTGFETKTVYVDSENLAEFIQCIEDEFNGKVDGWNDEINNKFKEAMDKLVAQVNEQVKDMMDQVAGQIDENLKDLIEEINKEVDDAIGGYIDTANKYISRYNSVANRINKYLENPNNYLQVMMCYKGADGGFYQLSNSKSMPSVFKMAGGNSVNLLPATYCAEIVAPPYKKFIAVTNVWKNGNEAVSAQNGDAACMNILKEANNVSLMCQPITGKTHRVPFAVSKAGYTYEIVYSALDYHGYTSTRKYYVTVK